MTNSKFPFRRLPYDLCSMVLKTMGHQEIIAYSFTSKKELAMVQSLRLSLEEVRINIMDYPKIYLDFGRISVIFTFEMGGNGEEETSVPINVDVSIPKPRQSRWFRGHEKKIKTFTWANQGKGIGEWVRHLCSIFRCEWYEASFDIGQIRFDMKSLSKAFPKLNRAVIKVGPNKIGIQSFQNISRALLPLVENVELNLHENLSIEHIGMANLEELKIDCPSSPNFDDLLIWNVERLILETEQFSLRSLNRFFKLWKKGSNPKLKYLKVHGEAQEDRNVLMKGLQAEEAEKVESKWKYTIQNCYGIRAIIKIYNDTQTCVSVKFKINY